MATMNPSELLATSLASLSSAYQAFAEIEDKARSEVARATAERDKAVDALHVSQLEGQTWKQEMLNYKASLKQAEITNSHQAETIAQLQRETSQWKDQSRNWQEHFLRVEQERCTLSTKVAELIAEIHQWGRSGITIPSTPKHHFSNISDSFPSSATTKRASTSSLNQPPAYKPARPVSPLEPGSPPASTSISSHKPPRPGIKLPKSSGHKLPQGDPPSYELPSITTSKAQLTSTRNRPIQMRQEPRQTVVRRVHAVVNVKREDSDDESGDGEYIPPRAEDVVLPTKMPKRRKRKNVPDDDDEYICDEEDDSNATKGQDVDGLDPSGEDTNVLGSEDEDDELIIGAEENHQELYGTRHVKVSTKAQKPHHAPEELPPHTKKRKIGVSTGREKASVKRRI